MGIVGLIFLGENFSVCASYFDNYIFKSVSCELPNLTNMQS